MDKELQKQLNDAIADGFNINFDTNVIRWCENNIVLPYSGGYKKPGKIDLSRSTYLKRPLQAAADPTKRRINCLGGIRTGKTTLLENIIPYYIHHEHGNIYWLAHIEKSLSNFVDTRLHPLLAKISSLERLMKSDKYAKTKAKIHFHHINLIISAANKSALDMQGANILIGDELKLWKQGYLQKALGRCSEFLGEEKVVFVSSSGESESDWIQYFNNPEFTIFDYGYKCPKCDKEQTFDWNNKRMGEDTYAGVAWPKDVEGDSATQLLKKANGAYIECYYCRSQFKEQDRFALNRNGLYLPIKKGLRNDYESYHWPSWASVDVPLSEIVKQYLEAKHYKDNGNNQYLETWIKDMSASKDGWSVEYFSASPPPLEVVEYDTNLIPDKSIPFIIVDCQDGSRIDNPEFATKYHKLCVVIRAWTPAQSWQLFRGYVSDFEAVDELQKKFNIPSNNVFVDLGNQQSRVLGECAKRGEYRRHMKTGQECWFGWQTFKGFDRPGFTHHTGDRKVHLYDMPKPYDVRREDGLLANVQCYHIADSPLKDTLRSLYLGRTKAHKWTVPNTDEDFERQMNAEKPLKIYGKSGKRVKWTAIQGRENDYLDCEKGQLFAAYMRGVFKMQ